MAPVHLHEWRSPSGAGGPAPALVGRLGAMHICRNSNYFVPFRILNPKTDERYDMSLCAAIHRRAKRGEAPCIVVHTSSGPP